MVQHPHLRVQNQKNSKQDLEEILHPHIHGSIIHKSQELETTQCLSMDKENGIYGGGIDIWLNIMQPLKRSVTCYNMDEAWGHNIKQNKPVTKKKKNTVIPLIWSI